MTIGEHVDYISRIVSSPRIQENGKRSIKDRSEVWFVSDGRWDVHNRLEGPWDHDYLFSAMEPKVQTDDEDH
jgi:hypothetical protein